MPNEESTSQKLFKAQDLISTHFNISNRIEHLSKELTNCRKDNNIGTNYDIEVYRAVGYYGDKMELALLRDCINDIETSKQKGICSSNLQITKEQVAALDVDSLTVHFETYEEPDPYEDYTITVTDIVFKGDVDFTKEQKQSEIVKLENELSVWQARLNKVEEDLKGMGVDL